MRFGMNKERCKVYGLRYKEVFLTLYLSIFEVGRSIFDVRFSNKVFYIKGENNEKFNQTLSPVNFCYIDK